MAGPTPSPIEAEEVAASGATAAPHVSRPRQASWALDASPSSTTSACPSWARGLLSAQWKPGYHGPACQGPQDLSEDSAKDQALQAWRGSPSLTSLTKGKPSARHLSLRGRQAKGLARPPASRGIPPRQGRSVSSTERTWVLRPPQSHWRQSVMTTALSLPFSCIKQSIKQRQARELQGLPLWC